MKKIPLTDDDPVVAEVRAVRAKLWREGGGTVAGYIALINKRTADDQGGARVIKSKKTETRKPRVKAGSKVRLKPARRAKGRSRSTA